MKIRILKLCNAIINAIIKAIGWIFLIIAGECLLTNLSATYVLEVDGRWALKGTDAYTMCTYEVFGEILGYWILPVLCFILARLFFKLSRRLSRKRRDLEQEQEVTVPFILYLRSFYADVVTGRPAERILKPEQTEEQLLVAVLDDIAPVVAIGRPCDIYSPKGAARLYVPGEIWQERVKELAFVAEFVVLRLGGTDNFWWEVDFCLGQLSPNKLLFVIPDLKDSAPFDELERKLQARGVSVDLSCLKGKKHGKSSILGFLFFQNIQDKIQAVFSPIKRRRIVDVFISAEDVLRESLSCFFRSHGGYVKRYSAAMRAGITWVIVIFMIVIMAANSYFKFEEFNQNRFPKEVIILAESSPYLQEKMEDMNDRDKVAFIFDSFFRGVQELDEQSMVELYQLTTDLMSVLSDREYQLLAEHLPDDLPGFYTDLLTVAKIYFTDYGYDLYIHYLKQGAITGLDQTVIPIEMLAPDVQMELQLRMEQIPCYYEKEKSQDAAHCYYVEARKVLLQMYEEGYAVEPALRSGLIF